MSDSFDWVVQKTKNSLETRCITMHQQRNELNLRRNRRHDAEKVSKLSVNKLLEFRFFPCMKTKLQDHKILIEVFTAFIES